MRTELAKNTSYDSKIKRAPASIAVFVDRSVIFSEAKDHHAMGACIPLNVLRAAYALGLGAVWLDESLEYSDTGRLLLSLP